jgi:hypothetical protein
VVAGVSYDGFWLKFFPSYVLKWTAAKRLSTGIDALTVQVKNYHSSELRADYILNQETLRAAYEGAVKFIAETR